MSSFLCFICHSTVNDEITDETRDKYREVVGINLCPDSQLCYICRHMLNKLSLFKSVCLKRSIEYPVLFSEKGSLNLQKSDTDLHVVCPEECEVVQHHNTKTYHYIYNYINNYISDNEYKKLDSDDINEYLNHYQVQNKEINDNEFDNDNFIDNDWAEHNNDHINKSKENDLQQFNCKNDSVDSIVKEVNDNIENNDKEDNEVDNETYEDNEVIIPKKIKKNKKRGLKKITLSLEEQKAELERKRKEKKYLEAEYKCYNCALGFLFKDTYQAHMMRHEESNGEYSCPLCTLRVSSLTLLRAHTSRHAERCVCYRCGARVTRRHHTCRHTRTRSLPCHMCASLFTDASGLQQHLKRVHTSKTSGRLHTCGVCGESYNTQNALRTHMIKHIKRKFPCDHCSATYSSPYTLSQHVKTHTGVSEAHYCDTCKAAFTTRKGLLAHKRNTMSHQQTLFECPICTRMCPNQRALASHIQTVHSASKEYTCTVCPARYTSRKSLVRHVRTHTDVPRLVEAVCHLCGSRFKGNNKLNRHLREVCEKAKLEEQLSVY